RRRPVPGRRSPPRDDQPPPRPGLLVRHDRRASGNVGGFPSLPAPLPLLRGERGVPCRNASASDQLHLDLLAFSLRAASGRGALWAAGWGARVFCLSLFPVPCSLFPVP